MEKKDLGYRSRKFTLTVLTMALIFIGAIIAGTWAGFAGQYTTLVGGILGAAGLYLTGNVANDFLSSKVNATVAVAQIKKSPVAQVASNTVANPTGTTTDTTISTTTKTTEKPTEPEVSAVDSNHDGE